MNARHRLRNSPRSLRHARFASWAVALLATAPALAQPTSPPATDHDARAAGQPADSAIRPAAETDPVTNQRSDEPAADSGMPASSNAAVSGEPSEAPSSAADEAAFAAALQADAAPASAASAPAAAGNVLNPDISVIADFALAAHSRRNLLAGAHDPARKGFNLQGVELALGAAVDPYFRFDAILVWTRDEVEIEEAYATTLDLPWQLQARAGLFLTRFGRANATHPHSWDFADQPFALSRVFGGESSRGLGVELSWLTPLPWYLELVASGTSADGRETARSFLSDSERSVRDPSDLLYVAAIKQFFPLSDAWSLAFGLSSALGPSAQGDGARTEVYGTDLYLKWRPTDGSPEALRLHVEALYRVRRFRGSVQDANGFAMLAYRFAQRWDAAARYELGSASFDSHGHATFDALDPEITAKRQRGTLSFTHYPTEFSRLRVQGSLDAPDYRPKLIWSAVLSLEVAIGPHRPHAF